MIFMFSYYKHDVTAANQKYSPVQTRDPDEFFSRENIELAMVSNRGGIGY